MINKQILMNFSALASLLLPGACLAQGASDNYPTKSVRIIAPFPPGGSVDTVGRLVAARLSESYGQTFVIDNRSGASGNIGMEIAANAPGDGYTLVINTIPLRTDRAGKIAWRRAQLRLRRRRHQPAYRGRTV